MIYDSPQTSGADLIIVHGREGVGKTTFGAAAPNPVILDLDGGLRGFPAIPRFAPRDLASVMRRLAEIRDTDHDRKTVVVDTVDALEPMVSQAVRARTGMDDARYDAFGAGTKASAVEWRAFLAACGEIVARGIDVILLAHSVLRAEESAGIGAEVQRFTVSLPSVKGFDAGALLRNTANVVMFATFVEVRSRSNAWDKVRAFVSGERVLKTQHGMSWHAKTRTPLPPEIPLDWAAFDAARKSSDPATAQLLSEFECLMVAVPEEKKAKIREAVESVKTDARALAVYVNRVREIAAESSPF